MSKLAQLKNKDSDRSKVEAWLDHIKCFYEDERQEVLDKCASDPDAKKYFVMRYNQDCK